LRRYYIFCLLTYAFYLAIAYAYNFAPESVVEEGLVEALGEGPQEVLVVSSNPLGDRLLDLKLYGASTEALVEYPGLGVYYTVIDAPGDLSRIAEIPGVTLVARPRGAHLADYIVEGEEARGIPIDYKNKATRAEDARREYLVGGRGTVVCVIDNGIDNSHPGLQKLVGESFDNETNTTIGEYESLVLAEEDFSSDGDNQPGEHGTHVAGIIAHQATDKAGMWGIAPGIEGFLDAKALSARGSGSETAIIKAIRWCAEEFKELQEEHPEKYRHLVYSLSLGLTLGPYFDPLVETIEHAAEEEDAVFVIAMGNEMVPDSPGVAANAITVGAADWDKRVAFFSGNGPAMAPDPYKPDVSAPGVKVYSSVPGGRYEYMSGTSMATPVVSGVVALAWERYPGEGWRSIKKRIEYTAEDTEEGVNREGYGFVHALNAVGTPDPRPSLLWRLRESRLWVEAKLRVMKWLS
jgi:subtilisin family serine protease